jgi:hypothetical protein
LLKIHFNIILPSNHGSSKWCLSFRFPHQKRTLLFSPPYVLMSVWGRGEVHIYTHVQIIIIIIHYIHSKMFWSQSIHQQQTQL